MVYLCLYGEVKFLWSRSSTEREVDALNSLFPFQIFSSLFRKTHSFPMCPFTPYPYWKIKMKLSLPFLSPLSLLSLSLSSVTGKKQLIFMKKIVITELCFHQFQCLNILPIWFNRISSSIIFYLIDYFEQAFLKQEKQYVEMKSICLILIPSRAL